MAISITFITAHLNMCRDNSLYSREEIVERLSHSFKMRKSTISILLKYLVKHGVIKKVSRGTYKYPEKPIYFKRVEHSLDEYREDYAHGKYHYSHE